MISDGRHEFEDMRKLSFVHFKDKVGAYTAIRELHHKIIPYNFGEETYQYKISVRMARQQNFKRDLQEELDEQFEAFQMAGRWAQENDPGPDPWGLESPWN